MQDPMIRSGGPARLSRPGFVKQILSAIAVIALLVAAAWYFAVYLPQNSVLDEDIPLTDTLINANVDEDASNETKAQAVIFKAQLLAQDGRYEESLQVIRGIENGSDLYNVQAIKVQAQEGLGRDTTATYARMLELYPGFIPKKDRNFTYYYELGRLAEGANKLDQAKQYYQQMIDKAPENIGEVDPETSLLIEVAKTKVSEL